MPDGATSPHEIPGFVPAAAIFARAAQLLYPRKLITVADWAVRDRVLENPGGGYSGPWRHETAPQLKRPMECLTDDRYGLVGIMGPGQSAKSEIGNNFVGHTVCEDPANMIWLAPDKGLLRSYVVEKINPMIRGTKGIADRQLSTPSADNIFSKEFIGCVVSFIHPVGSQFRMRSAPRWVADDFDGIPVSIGGEGGAITLLGTRTTTFEGREKGLVMSSPALGEKGGIEAIVASGTDERWHWRCLDCGDAFAPDYVRDFRFDDSGPPELARETAHVVCPGCGCVFEQKHKAPLQATGVWAGPEQTVRPDGTVEGPLRESSTASFRFDGLFGFSSWLRLAHDHRAAQIKHATLGDDGELRAFMNTRAGRNYRSEHDGKEPLTAEDLAGNAADYAIATVPAWVEVLTAAVDVQGNRFAVMVQGWGPGLQSAIVDRFDILQLADGRTNVAPAQYPEHWTELLRRVIWTRYPVAGDPARTLPILNTAIDTGGEDGVSDNAIKFWHAAKAARVSTRQVMLIKGGNNVRAKPVPAPTALEYDHRGRPKKHGAKLYVLNVHALKNTLDARLRRETPGPLYVHMPREFEDALAEYRDELTAEEKQDGRWVKTRPRNETWDLAVYNIAALTRWAGERADMSWVPRWARPSEAAPATQPNTTARPSPPIHQQAESGAGPGQGIPGRSGVLRRRGIRGGVRA